MKEKIQAVFAERLRELMQEKSLSQSALSVDTAIPVTSINGWLLQKRTIQIDALCKLADYFGVSVDYLLGREN